MTREHSARLCNCRAMDSRNPCLLAFSDSSVLLSLNYSLDVNMDAFHKLETEVWFLPHDMNAALHLSATHTGHDA